MNILSNAYPGEEIGLSVWSDIEILQYPTGRYLGVGIHAPIADLGYTSVSRNWYRFINRIGDSVAERGNEAQVHTAVSRRSNILSPFSYK